MPLKVITADELMRRNIPPARFVVSGVLPEGLSLLAGRPKIGKSWLALNIALAVSDGEPALGRPTEAGDVLYLALEDGERRLQDRFKKMLVGRRASDRLCFATECPRLGDGGEKAIREWAGNVSNPKLVVVDVFARIRPKGERNARLYDDDYQSVLSLKAIADDLGISVLVVTHTRKREAEGDPLDAVSATTGLTGAADTVLILDRNASGAALYGRGRDVEEFDLAIRFDAVRGTWTALGDREEVHRSDTRNTILAALRAAKEPIGPADIAKITGLSDATVRQRLGKMAKDGEVEKAGWGRYVSTHTPVTTVTSITNPSFNCDDSDGCDGGVRVMPSQKNVNGAAHV